MTRADWIEVGLGPTPCREMLTGDVYFIDLHIWPCGCYNKLRKDGAYKSEYIVYIVSSRNINIMFHLYCLNYRKYNICNKFSEKLYFDFLNP